MQSVQITLLGGFAVRVGGRPVADRAWSRRSSPALVRLLALAPGRTLHRDELLEALWPTLPPRAGQARLTTAVHYARRALGDPSAVARRGASCSATRGTGARSRRTPLGAR